MSSPAAALVLLLSLPAALALYKQWIPDTNYETAANWDKGAVPCGRDTVQFAAGRKVSVYVKAVHSALEMRLPVDGEMILSSGAAFVSSDGSDPACEGVWTAFRDAEGPRWLDPGLWSSAASWDDLQNGRFLFSVHEESVPCAQDDAVFREASSFRVDVFSGGQTVLVRSVSVLGRKFTDDSSFSDYLASRSGQLQFHNVSSLRIKGSSCTDATGCECGNSAHREQICAAVTCPAPPCHKAIDPAGHCCPVCGAIIALRHSAGFGLESYRQRLLHLFLGRPGYAGVRLALSKVLLGRLRRSPQSQIQVLLVDEDEGRAAGAAAAEILADARSNAALLGIEEAALAASSQPGGVSGGVVAAAILGALAIVAAVALVWVAMRRRLPKFTFTSSGGEGDLGGPLDHGFENPMFDKPGTLPASLGLYKPEDMNPVTLTHSGVHFVNPCYDETDFNA
ncbi:protein amnionless [Denticeps clupeoides]|uniref:Protein amnionless n=1 Tax=Denticeps clupeoides TaxID=299321 RepID=A0AAY4APN9_9TELE|nr:protein amnionless [Denticeps clupeoides]